LLDDELSDGILTLTLNRPEKLNALTLDMMKGILENLQRATEAEIRCVVIKGKGKHFCAGRDFLALQKDTSLDYCIRFDDTYTSIFQELRRLSKPSIAAVHGYAVGGGFALALGCDFLVAHADAQFGCLEMKHGFPAAINIALLSHHLGRRKAMEIAMTGELLQASTLRDLGLVNRLAELTEDFQEAVFEFAEKIARLDPIGVKFTKEIFQAVESTHLEDALLTGKQLNLWLASSGKINEAARKRSEGTK
jgi:enoyl-CoA hydratase